MGVANIREYEEKQLKQAQEQTERRVKLLSLQSKLANQLEYEKKRDLETPKKQLEKSIKEDEKRLAELKAQDAEARKQDGSFQKKIDKLKEELDGIKKQMDEIEIGIKTFKKGLAEKQNDSRALHKEVTSLVR